MLYLDILCLTQWSHVTQGRCPLIRLIDSQIWAVNAGSQTEQGTLATLMHHFHEISEVPPPLHPTPSRWKVLRTVLYRVLAAENRITSVLLINTALTPDFHQLHNKHQEIPSSHYEKYFRNVDWKWLLSNHIAKFSSRNTTGIHTNKMKGLRKTKWSRLTEYLLQDKD